ncbi:Rac guanine nucleotide exchange factor JJ [Diplonema papillatum]|nr:Rac guanine nucleotide exchange factor JJ [Diplonema papillatum]KAJ9472507.1 Rac guanine nucleotide exchange factor JJ [Diplonema papillatum]
MGCCQSTDGPEFETEPVRPRRRHTAEPLRLTVEEAKFLHTPHTPGHTGGRKELATPGFDSIHRKVRYSEVSTGSRESASVDNAVTIRYFRKMKEESNFDARSPMMTAPDTNESEGLTNDRESGSDYCATNSVDFRPPPKDSSTDVERKAFYLKKELFETEISYVKGLGQVCDYYMNPLKQKIDTMRKMKELHIDDYEIVDETFANLLQVRACAETLLKEMRKAIRQADDFANAGFGRVFAENTRVFRQYTDFINGYDKLYVFINGTKTGKCSVEKEKLVAFLQKKQAELEEGSGEQRSDQSLFGYLITPIQRLVRYGIFLRDLYRLDSDNADLAKAVRDIEDVCNYCNQSKQASEEAAIGAARLSEIQEEVGLKGFASRPGRSWVKEEQVILRVTSAPGAARLRTTRVSMFLFTDLLMLVKTRLLGKKAVDLWVQLEEIAEVQAMDCADASGNHCAGLSIRTTDRDRNHFEIILDSPSQRALWHETIWSSREAWMRRAAAGSRRTVGLELTD